MGKIRIGKTTADSVQYIRVSHEGGGIVDDKEIKDFAWNWLGRNFICDDDFVEVDTVFFIAELNTILNDELDGLTTIDQLALNSLSLHCELAWLKKNRHLPGSNEVCVKFES